MPELPEVETVRRGLIRTLGGATILEATLNRPDLRFPFPDNFAKNLGGRRINNIHRHGKYLLVELDPDKCLVIHLGMTGKFRLHSGCSPCNLDKHDHLVLDLDSNIRVIFNDTRRFGYMTILTGNTRAEWMNQKPLDKLGPDATTCPDDHLSARLSNSSRMIKQALADQTIIAGLGNIYVCEMLFAAKLAPDRKGNSIAPEQFIQLNSSMQKVLNHAIDKGGSSIRDYTHTDGSLGYFQNELRVYGRTSQPCYTCSTPISRKIIAGRSSFFCQSCQI